MLQQLVVKGAAVELAVGADAVLRDDADASVAKAAVQLLGGVALPCVEDERRAAGRTGFLFQRQHQPAGDALAALVGMHHQLHHLGAVGAVRLGHEVELDAAHDLLFPAGDKKDTIRPAQRLLHPLPVRTGFGGR